MKESLSTKWGKADNKQERKKERKFIYKVMKADNKQERKKERTTRESR